MRRAASEVIAWPIARHLRRAFPEASSCIHQRAGTISLYASVRRAPSGARLRPVRALRGPGAARGRTRSDWGVLQNAQVELRDQGGALTDGSGEFALERVPPGVHTVDVRYEGFRPARSTISAHRVWLKHEVSRVAARAGETKRVRCAALQCRAAFQRYFPRSRGMHERRLVLTMSFVVACGLVALAQSQPPQPSPAQAPAAPAPGAAGAVAARQLSRPRSNPMVE